MEKNKNEIIIIECTKEDLKIDVNSILWGIEYVKILYFITEYLHLLSYLINTTKNW